MTNTAPLLLLLAAAASLAAGQGSYSDPKRPIQAGRIVYQNGRITCTLGNLIGDVTFLDPASACHMFLYVNGKMKSQRAGNVISMDYRAPIRASVQCRAQCSDWYQSLDNIFTEMIVVQEKPFIGLLCGIAVGFLLLLALVVFLIVVCRRRRNRRYRALGTDAPPAAAAPAPTVEERAAAKERELEGGPPAPEDPESEGELEEDQAPPLPVKQRGPSAGPTFSMKQLEAAMEERNRDAGSDAGSSDWDNTNPGAYPGTKPASCYAEVTSEI